MSRASPKADFELTFIAGSAIDRFVPQRRHWTHGNAAQSMDDHNA